MIITIAILSALLIVSLFAIWNLVKKNEVLEDFIAKQSEAIDYCDKRLKSLDESVLLSSSILILSQL